MFYFSCVVIFKLLQIYPFPFVMYVFSWLIILKHINFMQIVTKTISKRLCICKIKINLY